MPGVRGSIKLPKRQSYGSCHKIGEQKSISIEWHIEDVQEVAKEKFNKHISEENALIVLNYINKKHDSSIGINWSVIEEAIEYLTKENSITLSNLQDK